jgi:hypothetical protein
MLVSQAAHGVSTSSLQGLGEISLRDATIVAAASVGARMRQAWLLLREQTPNGWTGAEVDVVVARKVGTGVRWVVGVELKWWRQSDPANAGNRRRELVRDFIRAASLYPLVESSSFVALLSTPDSWNRTTDTQGRDAMAMALIKGQGQQAWDVRALGTAPAVRGAAQGLSGAVPVPKHFRSELLSSVALDVGGHEAATARVWRVRKHQNTHFFSDPEVAAL